MAGHPIRIQSQIPAEGRTWLDLLRNIAGNVVNGKVHPPRLVTGVPRIAGANWGFVTVATINYTEQYNGFKLVFVTESDEYDPNTITIGDNTFIFSYTTISSTIADFATALAAYGIQVTVYGAAANTLMTDAVALFQDVAIEDGKEVECFPQASKDYIRVIQNCGTNAVKLLYSNTGHASASQFNQILAAGSAQDDGLGGPVQVVCSSRVTAIGVDGASVRLAITRIESPEAI